MRSHHVMFLGILVGTFAVSHTAQAQLINWERRNQRQTNELGKAGGGESRAQKADSSRGSSQTTASRQSATLREMLSSEPFVTSRVERIYDTNRDGRLQKDELTEFLGDVVSSVERRGSFTVSSELLRKFDTDEDGMISRHEILDIKADLN